MIEVLFGESEAASMKVAKSKVVHRIIDGPTVVWGTEKKKVQPDNENAGWIEGTSDEVICLGFMLEVGDISGEVSDNSRKELIYSLLYQEQYGKDSEVNKECMESAGGYIKELERLKAYIEKGESIRIWYSKSPYSMCGLYFICYWMRQYHNDIYTVELPENRTDGNVIISYQNWGEVAAEEFAYFLRCQKSLSELERKLYANKWVELKEDNSPLRVMLNNEIVGVPVEFYDFLIWKKLDEKPIRQARLIGTLLGSYPIGVGDCWYAKRIQYFIDQGLIDVVEDSEKKYARIIKKK